MSLFRFKYFVLHQDNVPLKLGTDAMLLGALADVRGTRILDIGSGSGVLALMAAQRNPNAHVTALEIDTKASLDCAKNLLESPFHNRLNFIEVDFFEFSADQKFDSLICNPPFYQNGLLSADKRVNRAKHSCQFPVLGFFEKCRDLLNEQGVISIVVPFEDSEIWINAAHRADLFCTQNIVIYSKPSVPTRMLLFFSNLHSGRLTKAFTVRDEEGYYTEEYIALTKEFHATDLVKGKSK